MNKDILSERFLKLDHMPFGDNYLPYAIETVNVADNVGDLGLKFKARYYLCRAAVFSNRYAVALDTFMWCVGAYEKDPANCDASMFLWMNKWILGDGLEIPGFSKQRILGLLEKFRGYFGDLGLSDRSYYYYFSIIAQQTGDIGGVSETGLRWLEYQKDWICDCHACETANHACTLLFLEDDEAALRVAKPLLNGEQRCEMQPFSLMSVILIPLVKLDRHNEAIRYHQDGYRAIEKKPWRSPRQFNHIQYLAHIGNLKRAVRLFLFHFKDLDNVTKLLHTRFSIYLASWFLMEALLENGHEPIGLPSLIYDRFFEMARTYEIEELRDHFQNLTTETTAMLDERNQNNYFSELVLRTLEKP